MLSQLKSAFPTQFVQASCPQACNKAQRVLCTLSLVSILLALLYFVSLVYLRHDSAGPLQWLQEISVLQDRAGPPQNPQEMCVGHPREGRKDINYEFGNGPHWGVITTIFDVSLAVSKFLDCWPNARIVVVGDCKTDDTAWQRLESTGRLVYLSPQRQATLPYRIVNRTPWNHFGRKSIGYMFAIHHGAELIFDFDDDNHLECNVFRWVVDRHRLVPTETVQTTHHVHNPYMWFKPENGLADASWVARLIWPRGFPLGWIKDPGSFSDKNICPTRDSSRVVVYQSLAQHDPDVDAIYRMTRPLPVNFSRNEQRGRVVPPGTLTPWNGQAVLFRRQAFWGMLLPISVTGRVSDIWRSYITSCLLWLTGFQVAFFAPFVTQYRNPHSYMKDFEDERDLYEKVDSFLAALAGWINVNASKQDSLDVAYVNLVRHLASDGFGYLGHRDVSFAEAWVADLKAAHYVWPSLLSTDLRQWKVKVRHPSVVDGRTQGLVQVFSPTKDFAAHNTTGSTISPATQAAKSQFDSALKEYVLFIMYNADVVSTKLREEVRRIYSRWFYEVIDIGGREACNFRQNQVQMGIFMHICYAEAVKLALQKYTNTPVRGLWFVQDDAVFKPWALSSFMTGYTQVDILGDFTGQTLLVASGPPWQHWWDKWNTQIPNMDDRPIGIPALQHFWHADNSSDALEFKAALNFRVCQDCFPGNAKSDVLYLRFDRRLLSRFVKYVHLFSYDGHPIHTEAILPSILVATSENYCDLMKIGVWEELPYPHDTQTLDRAMDKLTQDSSIFVHPLKLGYGPNFAAWKRWLELHAPVS